MSHVLEVSLSACGFTARLVMQQRLVLKESGEVAAPAEQGSQQVHGRKRSVEEHEASAMIKKKMKRKTKKEEDKQSSKAKQGKALQTTSHLPAKPQEQHLPEATMGCRSWRSLPVFRLSKKPPRWVWYSASMS